MISCPYTCPIGSHYPVFAHPFLEHTILTVESLEQGLILAADTLKGVAHHLSRNECFTVGYALVMFDDLRFDVVQCKIDVPCLAALAFGPVALDVPKRFRDTLFATEMRHSPVDCNPSHNGDNAVFLLASVHEEQDFECCSHTVLFWLQI